MKTNKKNKSTAHGILLQSLIAISLFSSNAIGSETHLARPTPPGYLQVGLYAAPTPTTLSMHSMPIQNARANAAFQFALKPYVGMSPVEISYQLYNGYYGTKKARWPYASDFALSGLPAGLIRQSNRAGDCPTAPVLGEKGSCILRFLVDPKQYSTEAGGTGPNLTSLIHYVWGSGGYQDAISAVASVQAPNRIADILPNVILPIRTLVTPAEQDGLHYDQATQSIIGTPTRTGLYTFAVSATNGLSTAAPTELKINVGIDQKDKPIFKTDYHPVSATPGSQYQLNLMDLLEPSKHFLISNQVHFKLDPNHASPDWLSIDKDSSTILQGKVPANEAGQMKAVTLIATSNTGGESAPYTIDIPVVFDPALKPVIDDHIQLTAVVDKALSFNLRHHISDPTADGTLNLVIEKIEPKAPWLEVSPENPTEISGVVPADALGVHYDISLRAHTQTGGSSDLKIISLNINIDPNKTPFFTYDNPLLPLFYPGQSYTYDFVSNNDIYPEYESAPYVVELAEEEDNPKWLRIENNQLIVDQVPDDLSQVESLWVTIKNKPGGKSRVILLKIFIMN